MGWMYADESKWERVYAGLSRASDRGDYCAADTEFYDVDLRTQNCVARSRIHLWSVAILRHPHILHPRGYHLSDAAVLPAAALDHPGLRRWLESSAPKFIHNSFVDVHSLRNHDISAGGVVNTLDLARWVLPERARGAGYSLDSLGTDLLGAGKTETFRELFSEEVDEVVRVKVKKVKRCVCGVLGCKKRKGHDKVTDFVEEPVIKRVRRAVPLQSVVPGHPLFDRAAAYSARDSIVGLGVGEVLMRKMQTRIPFPWL